MIFDGSEATLHEFVGEGCLPENIVLTLLAVTGTLYKNFAWVASTSYLILVSNLLANEFRLINDDMGRAHKNDREKFSKIVGDFRYRHWELCAIVSKANDLFCYHIGITLAGSSALLCMGIYTFIWSDDLKGNSTAAVISATWLCLNTAKITADCVAGINVYKGVSATQSTFVVMNSPVTGEFPSQRPMTRSFYVFFDLRLNKRLSKQTRR